MTGGQAMVIAIGFAGAIVGIGMGCGQIAEWWKERKKNREHLPLMRSALRTTVSCGPDRLYEMRFKFRDLATMQAADAEWRAHVSGVTVLPVKTERSEPPMDAGGGEDRGGGR